MTFDDFPNVWGAGQLLAFSGVDGRTSWFEPFVLHTDVAPGHLRVKLPTEVAIEFPGLDHLRCECLTGDAIVAGRYRAAFADDRTLAGTLPAGAQMRAGQAAVGQPAVIATAGEAVLWAGCEAGRWIIARRKPGEPLGAVADVDQLVADRTAYLRGLTLPDGLSAAERRLLRKAISVGKVNVEAPVGCIKRRWTTPDRYPHRHMWLWDSAFHAIGMGYYDLPLAQDAVLAMLEHVEDNGWLPLTVQPGGQAANRTQPPILAWAALALLNQGADPAWVDACRPYLFRYLEWDRLNRDANGNGIPEWAIQDAPLCRCGESGLDNSPVYDGAVPLDAPDFGAFLAHDYACLAEMARRSGDESQAATCEQHAGAIGAKVRELLWWPERELFFHRDFQGRFVDCEAVSGFVPLFAGIASPEQAAALGRHLDNPATFGAPVPVPTVSLRSGTFSKDMWRGPSWANLSYLVYLGLRRYGDRERAARLRTALLDTIGTWYATTGCLWEYYDALGLTPPIELDRKQRISTGLGITPISDYHWTAAVTVALLCGDAVVGRSA
ncbi:MAG: hypothetical protein K9N49_02355 [Candidatus Marinimicrobia bacterium]|nr:hypothetical protein [Candidatus Neomarinimicrobiota bacterium]